MRSMGSHRRAFIDFRRILIGDYVILVTGLMTLISLFMPWFVSSIGPTRNENAFAYSPVVSTAVIVIFLISLVLVIYPALSPDARMPPLPFATPIVFLALGAILVLLFTYELGKYDCIACNTVTRGYGVLVAWVASWAYVIGAVIKWGSRPLRRAPLGDSFDRA